MKRAKKTRLAAFAVTAALSASLLPGKAMAVEPPAIDPEVVSSAVEGGAVVFDQFAKVAASPETQDAMKSLNEVATNDNTKQAVKGMIGVLPPEVANPLLANFDAGWEAYTQLSKAALAGVTSAIGAAQEYGTDSAEFRDSQFGANQALLTTIEGAYNGDEEAQAFLNDPNNQKAIGEYIEVSEASVDDDVDADASDKGSKKDSKEDDESSSESSSSTRPTRGNSGKGDSKGDDSKSDSSSSSTSSSSKSSSPSSTKSSSPSKSNSGSSGSGSSGGSATSTTTTTTTSTVAKSGGNGSNGSGSNTGSGASETSSATSEPMDTTEQTPASDKDGKEPSEGKEQANGKDEDDVNKGDGNKAPQDGKYKVSAGAGGTVSEITNEDTGEVYKLSDIDSPDSPIYRGLEDDARRKTVAKSKRLAAVEKYNNQVTTINSELEKFTKNSGKGAFNNQDQSDVNIYKDADRIAGLISANEANYKEVAMWEKESGEKAQVHRYRMEGVDGNEPDREKNIRDVRGEMKKQADRSRRDVGDERTDKNSTKTNAYLEAWEENRVNLVPQKDLPDTQAKGLKKGTDNVGAYRSLHELYKEKYGRDVPKLNDKGLDPEVVKQKEGEKKGKEKTEKKEEKKEEKK